MVWQYQQLQSTDSVTKYKKPKPTRKARQYDLTIQKEWAAERAEQTWIHKHPEEVREQEAEWLDEWQ